MFRFGFAWLLALFCFANFGLKKLSLVWLSWAWFGWVWFSVVKISLETCWAHCNGFYMATVSSTCSFQNEIGWTFRQNSILNVSGSLCNRTDRTVSRLQPINKIFVGSIFVLLRLTQASRHGIRLTRYSQTYQTAMTSCISLHLTASHCFSLLFTGLKFNSDRYEPTNQVRRRISDFDDVCRGR